MDITESKAVLSAINLVAIELVKDLKGGVNLADAVSILEHIAQNDALKAALVQAYQGVSQISAELKDLSVSEGVELASLQLSFVPQIMDALKG